MGDQQMLRPACEYAQSDQSFCCSLEFSMNINLLTEYHLEFLSLKGGCTGSSESIHVKMPHCWKSHVTTQLCLIVIHVMNIKVSQLKERISRLRLTVITPDCKDTIEIYLTPTFAVLLAEYFSLFQILKDVGLPVSFNIPKRDTFRTTFW